MILTKEQRRAVAKVHQRIVNNAQSNDEFNGTTTPIPTYRQTRRTVQPGFDCVMMPYAGMWLGIEKDGYTHS